MKAFYVQTKMFKAIHAGKKRQFMVTSPIIDRKKGLVTMNLLWAELTILHVMSLDEWTALPICCFHQMTKDHARTEFIHWVDGIGASEAARLLGCTKAMVSYLYNGKRNAGQRLAQAIEDHVGIPARVWTSGGSTNDLPDDEDSERN